MEDFGRAEKGSVVISTIHRSKGREYDSVYMMLNKIGQLTDEKRRAIYVGITRAKEALRVHYSDDSLFEGVAAEGVVCVRDDNVPLQPENVILNLTHKDVVLDYFLDKKAIICELRSGMRLEVDGVFLVSNAYGFTRRVAKFSGAFIRKLESLSAKGYMPRFAKIRYVVAWKKEGCAEESAVILPDLYLSR